jgi:hypothetical protein
MGILFHYTTPFFFDYSFSGVIFKMSHAKIFGLFGVGGKLSQPSMMHKLLVKKPAKDIVQIKDILLPGFHKHMKQDYRIMDTPPDSGKTLFCKVEITADLLRDKNRKCIFAVPDEIAGTGAAKHEKIRVPAYSRNETLYPEQDIDWIAENLTGGKITNAKIKIFDEFLKSPIVPGENPLYRRVIVVTHAFLIRLYKSKKQLKKWFFNVSLVIDEAHHIDSGEDADLGKVIRFIMQHCDDEIITLVTGK